jgi:hypothetical protein
LSARSTLLAAFVARASAISAVVCREADGMELHDGVWSNYRRYGDHGHRRVNGLLKSHRSLNESLPAAIDDFQREATLAPTKEELQWRKLVRGSIVPERGYFAFNEPAKWKLPADSGPVTEIAVSSPSDGKGISAQGIDSKAGGKSAENGIPV